MKKISMLALVALLLTGCSEHQIDHGWRLDCTGSTPGHMNCVDVPGLVSGEA